MSSMGDRLPLPGCWRLVIQLLCGFMLLWQLFLTPSWVGALYPSYSERLRMTENAPVPDDTASKYKGQVAVVLLHHLPSLLWCMLMPVQLFSHSRTAKLARTWLSHRLLGYVTAACAVAVAAGVVLMQHRGLDVIAPDIRSPLKLKAAWFLFTMGMAVSLARQRQYQQHRAWMLRHAAAGLWVAVQRILIIALAIAGNAGFVDWRAPPDEGEGLRANAFEALAMAAFCICVLGCELYLWGERQQQRTAVKRPHLTSKHMVSM